jgi:hypothetical protein
MKIELPVSNRIIAIHRILAINSLLFTLFLVFVPQIYDFDTLKYLIIIISISALVSFNYFRKQNIHKAFFDKGMIKLVYNKESIEFPISQMLNISESLYDYFNLNDRTSFTYTIELKDRHHFGQRLFINFNKDILDSEPNEIIVLREMIKNGC